MRVLTGSSKKTALRAPCLGPRAAGAEARSNGVVYMRRGRGSPGSLGSRRRHVGGGSARRVLLVRTEGPSPEGGTLKTGNSL